MTSFFSCPCPCPLVSFSSSSTLSSSSSSSTNSVSRASFPTHWNSFSRTCLNKFRVTRGGGGGGGGGGSYFFAEASLKDEEFTSDTAIDVVADIKTERVVVIGGSGFVGSAICKAAVSKGIEAVSLSRSGRPTFAASWVDQVTWIPGDVFYANWDEILTGATAVVSTLGGFGSEEMMQRINGEANIVAVNAAKDRGVPKFILISVHDYNLPTFLLSSGYFAGKRKAESEVLSKYPNSGVVLRPGFIYGKRKIDGFEIPLDFIGEPVERILHATENFTKPLNSLPASDLLLAPPISVDDVALAVLNAVTDDDFFGVFTIEQIKEAAAKVKA